MAFSMPRNVPDFADPQRQLEDRAWGSASGRGNRHSGIVGGVQDRVSSMFDSETLPMYKDKPWGYAPSKRSRSMWRRKRTYGSLTLGVFFVLYMLGFISNGQDESRSSSTWSWMGLSEEQGAPDWDKRRQHVVEAFELSWDAYERYGWGE